MSTINHISHNKDCILSSNQMNWNVISEGAGEYILFIMKLKESKIGKEKENSLKRNSNLINTVEQKSSALLYINECCQLNVGSILY